MEFMQAIAVTLARNECIIKVVCGKNSFCFLDCHSIIYVNHEAGSRDEIVFLSVVPFPLDGAVVAGFEGGFKVGVIDRLYFFEIGIKFAFDIFVF